ncbi:OmpA family protein [Leptobacterium flavescens]|uniref:OmpA family protein n=1 Tax=Leptobacterium flavescens TaxID=472055 RepID=A0A6P0UKM3_9FLAO|nr:OmpA family protein [Leptobacterium flavescens]NER13102.1 OmpA family protein [Leptobacterium flavescens]
MKKITLFTLMLLCTGFLAHAQKKKELLEEIEQLRSKLQNTETALAESQKNEKISSAKLSSAEEQLTSLKETNASLLSNLNNFTEVSKKKSDNVSKTLESLREKERQLKVINDALSSNDSIKLAVFSAFKNAVGADAQIGIKGGVIMINISNTLLFGDNDKNYMVEDKAKGLLERIGTALNNSPDIKITIEGNSNALEFKDKSLLDNWDLSARQAASVVRVLETDYKVDPKRMDAMGKSQYGSDALSIETSTRIVIHPKFDEFYSLIRENMKN